MNLPILILPSSNEDHLQLVRDNGQINGSTSTALFIIASRISSSMDDRRIFDGNDDKIDGNDESINVMTLDKSGGLVS